MSNAISVNGKELGIKVFNGVRVVTFKDIDRLHEKNASSARVQFNRHKKHFIQGEDYFVTNSDEAKALGITAPTGLNLITESGYLLIAKTFEDDLSWKVQKELIKCYFTVKELTEQSELKINQYKPKMTSAGEVASLIKVLERTMKKQGNAPHEIAQMQEMICKQFSIELPENFVRKPIFIQQTIMFQY